MSESRQRPHDSCSRPPGTDEGAHKCIRMFIDMMPKIEIEIVKGIGGGVFVQIITFYFISFGNGQGNQ